MKIFCTVCLCILSFGFYFSTVIAQIRREELYEGDFCRLNTGSHGKCTKMVDCQPVMNDLQQGIFNNKVTCLFEGFMEIVCCPMTETHIKFGISPAEEACSEYENEINNNVEELTFHILNGYNAAEGEFPYIAAVGIWDKNDAGENVIKYTCGGTLISPQYVLTAAHCVNNLDERVPVQVRFGAVDIEAQTPNVQEIQIDQVTSHPKYLLSQGLYDIALLRLKNPIRWTSYVRPICLQTKILEFDDTSANGSFIVTGWGTTDLGASRSNKLLKTPPLTLLPSKNCERFYTGSNFPNGLGNHSFCAQDSNRTRRSDACQGDSGGPLVHVDPNGYDTLVGVTSFGQFCGSNVPGGYMSVYSFLNWIEKIVWP